MSRLNCSPSIWFCPPGRSLAPTPARCEAADFAGFPAGSIALMQRGTCTFAHKVANAQAAGAAGVLIFNEGQPGRTAVLEGTLAPFTANVIVFGTSFAVGNELSNGVLNGPTGLTVHMNLAVPGTRHTRAARRGPCRTRLLAPQAITESVPTQAPLWRGLLFVAMRARSAAIRKRKATRTIPRVDRAP